MLLAENPEQFSTWDTSAHLDTVSTTGGDFFPTVSKDGLSLYFTINTCDPNQPPPDPLRCYPDPLTQGGFDIYVSQRQPLLTRGGRRRTLAQR
jgi:hypothetical protein